MKNNVKLTETSQIVEHFSEFFSSVGNNLENSLQPANLSPLVFINRNPHTFHLFPVTPDECCNINAIIFYFQSPTDSYF